MSDETLDPQDNFVQLALDEIPEETVLPDGSEHSVQIVSAKIGTSKGEKTAGQKYLMVTFKSLDDPDAKLFNDIFMLPSQEDKESFNNRGRALKRFFDAIEFDSSGGFNATELEGLTAEVLVTVEDNQQYGEQNRVKRYL